MGKFKGIRINPELPVVLLITGLLLLGGLAIILFGDKGEFNFYSSKINIDGTNIQEELHFKPDKSYHTLYRTFTSEAYWNSDYNFSSKNYLTLERVECSAGNSYLKDYLGMCYNSNGVFNCPAYTEKNEYGCTFGNDLGFSKGKEYVINAEYKLNPENLFKINGEYYVKFVVYSPENHIKLNHKNFVVNGDVVKKEKYFTNENVVLYIPYIGDISNFKIVEQGDFEFDSGYFYIIQCILLIFFSFLPGIFFFLLWVFIGKEKYYEDVPKELSDFPTNRKFWEVAAYFNPPFSRIDKNFFASILLSFYNKKIIDVKEKDDEIYVKLNKFEGDSIEKKVYNILEKIKENLKPDLDKSLIDGEYFNLKKAMLRNNDINLYKKFTDLQNEVRTGSKKYIKGASNISVVIIVIFALMFMLFGPLFFLFLIFVSFIAGSAVALFGLYLFTFIVIIVLFGTGPIFTRYNEEYYAEYQKWKAFKRYLKNSFSIKTATHKSVVIWEEYLIYATALGVSDKVVEELKSYHIIDEKKMNIYNGVIMTSSFAFFGGSTGGFSGSTGGGFSGGGGFGGAGGGGIGGGGGGGR